MSVVCGHVTNISQLCCIYTPEMMENVPLKKTQNLILLF